MSKELGYKQVKNVESRRTWDRDYYEAKAKERIEKGDDYQDKDESGPSRRSQKEEFQPAAAGAAGPAGSARAYLKVLWLVPCSRCFYLMLLCCCVVVRQVVASAVFSHREYHNSSRQLGKAAAGQRVLVLRLRRLTAGCRGRP